MHSRARTNTYLLFLSFIIIAALVLAMLPNRAHHPYCAAKMAGTRHERFPLRRSRRAFVLASSDIWSVYSNLSLTCYFPWLFFLLSSIINNYITNLLAALPHHHYRYSNARSMISIARLILSFIIPCWYCYLHNTTNQKTTIRPSLYPLVAL